jgi:hypothetical protein
MFLTAVRQSGNVLKRSLGLLGQRCKLRVHYSCRFSGEKII